MKEPTKAQVKKFWKLVGFQIEDYGEYVHGPMMHGGKVYDEAWFAPNRDNWLDELPPIDPNSLFKYAEPKLDEIGEHYIVLQKMWNDTSIKIAEIEFVNPVIEPNSFEGKGSTYALALFWACYKVLKE